MNESEKIERINQLYSKAAQQERRKLFSKDIESLLPIENIDELKQIKDRYGNERIFTILIFKTLVIDEKHFNLQNYEALKRLELERAIWIEIEEYFQSRSSYKDGFINGNIDINKHVTQMISQIQSEGESKSFNFKQRIEYLHSVTKMLLDNYGESIKLSLRVTVEGKIIDLFVRVQSKRAFALMVRSYEDTFVSWHLDKKDFYVTSKRRKGTDKWNSLSKAIVQLKSVFALKKEKNPVLGVTKAERTAPIIRAIVLAEGTEIDKNRNAPELWVEFGKAPALRIVTDTLTYIVEQQYLVDFLTSPDN